MTLSSLSAIFLIMFNSTTGQSGKFCDCVFFVYFCSCFIIISYSGIHDVMYRRLFVE